MPNGYWGKILRVDLTTKKVSEEKISEEYCRKYLGGVGFAADILYKEVGPEVGALDPENRLIMGVGPFQASPVPGSGKFITVAKSPLTNAICYSMAGGSMAQSLKKTGYDTLIVQGKSDKPIYLWINDGKVEFKDASSLLGKNTAETADMIREELNEPKASVIDIGPSGEKLIAFACLVVDKHSFAGRGGLGAVMGSKNLKAIAVKGTKTPEIADSQKIRDLTRELNKRIRENAPEAFLKGGTTCEPAEERGDLPVKYWKGDSGLVWDKEYAKLNYPYYSEALNVDLAECAKIACQNCPIHCHRHIETKEPAKYAVTGSGPEYEALGMLGGCNLVDDLHAIAKANEICNLYGLDVISAGAFAAFATECYEKGLLNKDDTFGMELKWGDGDQLVEVIRQIANKEKLGALAADGIVKAAEKIGGEAPSMAVHVKGMDFPAHDPRAFFSLAVSYATSSRGACHTHGLCYQSEVGLLIPEMGITEAPPRFVMEGKDYVAAKFHDASAILDSATQCGFMVFGGFGLTDVLNSINAITGWNMPMDEFLKIGERISTLKRAVNVKWGFSRKDDKLPEVVNLPSKKGVRAGKTPKPSEVESAISGYYKIRGWDSDGKPTPETMKNLGLS
ncbi:MAG: aldehyde ferredoxin oxidoreductase family protein [Candidatus Atribacteria bacterium]|nr:aldehyde ferredoxin oxidoreductase family protein [Candidatus Atribacteria bacterium]